MSKLNAMAKKRTIFKIILMVVIVFGLICFLFRFVKGVKMTNAALDQFLPITYSILSSDSNLISEKYRDKLKKPNISHIKGKEIVSLYEYDQKYNLIISKLNVFDDIQLSRAVHYSVKSVNATTMVPYYILNLDKFYTFKYSVNIFPRSSQIYLTLSGDPVKSFSNDSVVNYQLICDNFSLKYGEKQSIDIYMTGGDKPFGSSYSIPLDLMLLKRNGAIYLLIMTPKDPELGLPINILHDIVTG